MDREEKPFLERSLRKVYERGMAHRLNPMLFGDRDAEGIVKKLSYAPETEPSKLSCYIEGLRQELAKESAKAFLRREPFGTVVLYECGLDLPFSQFDNGRCRCLTADSKEHLEIRNTLIPERIREKRIACRTMDEAAAYAEKESRGPVFVIFSDRLLFLEETDVKRRIDQLARRFHGGGMFFEYRKKSILPPELSERFAGNREAVKYYVRDSKREIPYYSGMIRSAEWITHLPQGYERLLPAKEGALLEMMLTKEIFAFANLLFE